LRGSRWDWQGGGHREPAPARLPNGWNHPADENSRKFNMLDHVPIEKVFQLFRNTL